MRHVPLLVTTALLAHAGIGAADPETAEAAFARGQAAFKAGRIHQACDAYEASDRLAASLDTELSLAACYEQDGKPMTAARLYRRLAETDANAERRKASSAKAAKLEAGAPRLRFAINPIPPGLVVEVDGVVVSSTADLPVDDGPHEVVATAPGYAGHASAPVDRDHAIIDVIVRMEPRAEPAPTAAAPATVPTPAATAPTPAATVPTPAAAAAMAPPPVADAEVGPRVRRRRYGIAAGAAGLGVGIGAGVLFALATHKFDDEHALCPSSKCANDTVLAQAESILSDARTLRDVGIGASIGGGILLIASGYLLFAPHREESHLSFQVGRDGAGVAYTAGF